MLELTDASMRLVHEVVRVPWQFSLVMAVTFGTIAAGMSFLITYEEYSRHQLLSRERVMKESLRTAVVAWVFFASVAFLAGTWVWSIVQFSPSVGGR